jgi:hypothetical protein
VHKGYKCLHFPTGRIYIFRDIIFYEHVFPFSKLPAQSSCTTPIDASVILIPSPSSLTGHAAILVSNSTNLRADAPSEVTDDVMLVANGEQQQRGYHISEPEHGNEVGAASECDRTTSEMRGLSPKIISGDSRRSGNAQTHTHKHTVSNMKFKLKLLQIKCHVLGFIKDIAQNML